MFCIYDMLQFAVKTLLFYSFEPPFLITFPKTLCELYNTCMCLYIYMTFLYLSMNFNQSSV